MPAPRIALSTVLGGLIIAAAAHATAAEPVAARQAIAGTYFGSLALAGCGRADALLQLGADHAYTLQAHCVDTLQDLPLQRGTWSIEWNGTCLRLAPATVFSAGGHEFALASDDLLVLASGSCIEPVDDPRGRSLHRARSAEHA